MSIIIHNDNSFRMKTFNIQIYLFCTSGRQTKPLGRIEKDKSDRFLKLFTDMGDVTRSVDVDVASEYLCHMYGQVKTKEVNEARYTKLMKMTGKIDKVRIPAS